MTRYPASWSKLLIVTSVLAVLACALAIAAVLVFVPGWGRLFALPVIAAVLGGVPFMVRGYALDGSTLWVQRPFWNTRVPLDDLREVRLEPKLLWRSIRIFGNGGLFSFTGLFRNRELGTYRAFVTDWRNGVALRFSTARTVVISPAPAADFVAALKAARRLP